MFCVKNLNKSMTLEGKIRVAAFKFVNTKSFVFPRLKAYEKIYKNMKAAICLASLSNSLF